MEIIFTLILLIGIGINSHRYDVRNKEVPKQEVTSFIEEDLNNNKNQLQVLSNTEGEIEISNDISNELSEIIQKSESKKMESKGKYISVRINDGNG